MVEMIIKKIKLHNIRSYLDQEIELPKGSVLLSGDIGSGKSTVLFALEFALFGLQRGLVEGSSLLRNGKNEGFVEVQLEIAGHNITIRRTLKRHTATKTVTQDSASIIIDGKKKELTATELKSFVLDILNYPPSLLTKRNLIYRYTVYCPQEEMKRVVLENSETRLDTLRKVFDVDKYERILANLELFVAALKEKKKEKESQQTDLQLIKAELELKTNSLANLKKNLSEIEPELTKVQQEILELKNELKQQRQKIEKAIRARTKIEGLTATIEEKTAQLKELEHELYELETSINKLRTELASYSPEQTQELKRAMVQTEYELTTGRENEKVLEKQFAMLEARKETLLNDSKKISSLKICPVCKQEVDQEHRQKITLEIQQELAKIEPELNGKKAALNKLKEELKRLEQQFKQLVEKERILSVLTFKLQSLKEKETERTKINASIVEIKNFLTYLKQEKQAEMALLSNYNELEQNCQLLETRLEEKQHYEKTLLIKKSSLEQNAQNLQHELTEIQYKLKQKEAIAEAFNKLEQLHQFLTQRFSVIVKLIERQIMLKLNHEFNVLFKQWFAALIEDPSLEASVDLEFSPVITQAGYEINYDYLSGGERTALALAYRLALNQVVNSVFSKLNTKHLLILDEPTDGFSAEQLDKMRNVLQQLKVKQLIIVSHEAQMESFVDYIIKFTKQGHVSSVEILQ